MLLGHGRNSSSASCHWPHPLRALTSAVSQAGMSGAGRGSVRIAAAQPRPATGDPPHMRPRRSCKCIPWCKTHWTAMP
eukprot:2667816-Alexandrium_andersonii.AAC.1